MTRIILCALIGAGAVACYFYWLNTHDAALQTAADVYEQCIKTQYRITPWEYNGEYGTLPVCNK